MAQAKATPSRVPGPLLQRRLHHRPAGRGHPEALQGLDALPGRALDDARTTSGTGGSSCTGETLDAFWPVVGHRDRPAGHHDGERGLVPRERARPGDERRRGRLPRLVSAPAHRQRLLRDPEPGPRARQQLLRASPRTWAPTTSPRVGHADRHVRRPLADRRLQGPDRRGSTCTGPGRRTWPASIDIEALRDHRARAQWDNWMKDLRTEIYQLALRAADLPEEPVPRSGAVHPQGVPRAGDREADRHDDRARHLAALRPGLTAAARHARRLAPMPGTPRTVSLEQAWRSGDRQWPLTPAGRPRRSTRRARRPRGAAPPRSAARPVPPCTSGPAPATDRRARASARSSRVRASGRTRARIRSPGSRCSSN